LSRHWTVCYKANSKILQACLEISVTQGRTEMLKMVQAIVA
jgi:hypothetical protein